MKTILFIISMVFGVLVMYCETKIDKNTFTDKKATKYWVGMVIGSIVVWCALAVWNYIEFGI